MKGIITITALLISLNTFSQNQKEHVFDSFYYKMRSNHATLKTVNELTIKQFKNSFLIQSYISSYQQLTNIEVRFKESFDFAGNQIYSYEGLGTVFGNIEVNVAIDSRIKFEDLIKGKGYKLNANHSIENFEIKIYYWKYGTNEPLLKEVVTLYPIQNLSVKEKEEQRLKNEKIDTLENTFYNIDNYIEDYTTKTYPSIEKLFTNILFKEDFDFSKQLQREIKDTYDVRLYADKDRNRATFTINNKTKLSTYKPNPYDYHINYKLPTIKETLYGEEYELNREANFILKYDVTVGEALIKNKKSKLSILTENTFSEKQLEVLHQFFKDKKKGKYAIKYQIGTINNSDATMIKAVRQQTQLIGF